MHEERRSYEVLGVLGQGGFGRVYRARLRGPEGFVKDVALKLLTDMSAPDTILKRFRDESRILGLIRDRAVINVDPPTRLDGRWAVVMEYAEGESLNAVLKRLGRIPPKVALRVVQEVARALDRIYNSKGPDDAPLRVLHRDLKPANLQITRSGDLKILDFGISKAEFEMREAETTIGIGGTPGYIAPERLSGIEGQFGDIFSLGVVLRRIMTGASAKNLWADRRTTHEVRDADLRSALQLSDQMTSEDHEARPSAREVEREAARLAQSCGGLELRDWCESTVSENLGHIEDDLIGTVLTETMASVPSEVTDVRRLLHTSESSRPALATAFAMGSLGTVVAVVGLGLVIIGGILLFFSTNGPGGQPVEPSVGAEVAPEVAAAPVEPAPAVEPDPESAPELLEVEAREAVDPQPRRTTAVRPPAPAPAPDVVMYELIITSFPMGAEVYIDDQKVGVTPLIDQPVPGGQRVLRLVSGDQEVSESITVDRRAPRRYVWRVDEGLESSF